MRSTGTREARVWTGAPVRPGPRTRASLWQCSVSMPSVTSNDGTTIAQGPGPGTRLTLTPRPDTTGCAHHHPHTSNHPGQIRGCATPTVQCGRRRAPRSDARTSCIPSSGRGPTAVLTQVLRPRGGHRDECTASRLMMTRDEASVVGVLPHRQARARRPPRVEHLGVGAGVGTHPLEEVEDQGVAGIGQSGTRGLAHAGQCVAS